MPINLLLFHELKEIIDRIPRNIISAQLKDGISYEAFLDILDNKKLNKTALLNAMPYIDETTRSYLSLRDTDIIVESKSIYSRRS